MTHHQLRRLVSPVLAGALICGLAPTASARTAEAPPTTAHEVLERRAPHHPALTDQLIKPTSRNVKTDIEPIVQGGNSLFMPASSPAATSIFMSADLTESLSIRTVGATRSTTEDGVQTTESISGTTVVSHLTPDGSLQVAAVIDSPAESFALETSAGEGDTWKVTRKGSVELVTPAGEVVASIAEPWAIDAKGKRLPTHFSVANGIITQQIDYSGASFPVVADPSVVWWVATGAKCAAEIATTFGPLAATKIARIAENISTLATKSKAVAAAVTKLGGATKAATALAKLAVIKVKESRVGKYVKVPSVSLTPAQRTAAGAIWAFASANIWDFLGFGSCGALLAQA